MTTIPAATIQQLAEDYAKGKASRDLL